MPDRLAFGVAADSMRIDGQQAAGEVPSSSAHHPEVRLESVGLGDRMGIQQVVNGLIARHEGQSIGQLESFLRQTARLTDTRHAQSRFMYQLQCQARFDALGRLLGPLAQKIPRAQPQMLGHQQPQAHHVARDLVGQQLTHAPFDRPRVGRLGAYAALGAISFSLDGVSIGPIPVEFFFVGRIRRRCGPRFSC